MQRLNNEIAKSVMATAMGFMLGLSLESWTESWTLPRVETAAIAQTPRLRFKRPRLTTTPPSTANRRGKAAGRGEGECPQSPVPLTALLPSDAISQQEYAWGKTQSPKPTLWIYMPYAKSSGLSFSTSLEVKDSQGKSVAKTLSLPDQPGIMRVRLPQALPSLEVGQFYQWTLTVGCSPVNTISGWIERTPAISPPPDAPLERAEVYADSGLWYDTLTTLGNLQRQGSAAGQAAWQELLSNEGLQDVAQQPITAWDN